MENGSHLIREKRVSKIESSYSLRTGKKGNSAYSLGIERVFIKICTEPNLDNIIWEDGVIFFLIIKK